MQLNTHSVRKDGDMNVNRVSNIIPVERQTQNKRNGYMYIDKDYETIDTIYIFFYYNFTS